MGTLFISDLGWYQWAFLCVYSCVLISAPGTKNAAYCYSYLIVHAYVCVQGIPVTGSIPASPPLNLPDVNHLVTTHFELNELPLSLALNHISLSDMGMPGQTHTPPLLLCLSTQINSHSSKALSCPKLHLWIIDRLLPQRPQFGIMRIKTRVEKVGWEKCKRAEQRRRAGAFLIPAPGQNPSKHLFCLQNNCYIFLLLL